MERNGNSNELENSLAMLIEYLYKHHKKRVMVLIDEYDTPLLAGYANKYHAKLIQFMGNFLSPALKDNRYLFQGILTGVLKVAKNSLFDSLNNVTTYSVLSERYSEFFGFTSEEVKEILQENNCASLFNEIQAWYGGFNTGKVSLFCPWSVINFIENK